MNASLALTARIVLAAATLGAGAHAFAGQELMGVDTRFRAKIAKEKIRIAAQERKADEQGKSQGNSSDSTSCGSQNIGNIDTGGRIGANAARGFRVRTQRDQHRRPRRVPLSGRPAQGRSQMKPPKVARLLALSAALAALAGCQTLEVKQPTIDQTNEIRKGPEDRPQRSITGFSHALRCMDTLLLDYGVRDITMLTEEISDETKKLNAGTRDMLISSVSDMSRRSRAVRLVAFGKDTANVISYLASAQSAAAYQAIPLYDIKGSVSQFDENLVKNQKDIGIGFAPFINLGAAKDAGSSMLALDLSVLTTSDMAVLAGVTSRNSVMILKQGSGIDGDAAYHKFGINYSMNLAKAEGQTQALRGLVELAAVELIGKLTKTPYWTCLGVTDPKKNDETRLEMFDWYHAMASTPHRADRLLPEPAAPARVLRRPDRRRIQPGHRRGDRELPRRARPQPRGGAQRGVLLRLPCRRPHQDQAPGAAGTLRRAGTPWRQRPQRIPAPWQGSTRLARSAGRRQRAGGAAQAVADDAEAADPLRPRGVDQPRPSRPRRTRMSTATCRTRRPRSSASSPTASPATRASLRPSRSRCPARCASSSP